MNIKVVLIWCYMAIMASGLDWYEPSSAERVVALYLMDNIPVRSTTKTCYFLATKSYSPGEYNIDLFTDLPSLLLHADTFHITQKFNSGLEYQATNLLKLDKGIHYMKYQLYYYGWIRPDCWCSKTPLQEVNNSSTTTPSIDDVSSTSSKKPATAHPYTTNNPTKTTSTTDQSTIKTTDSTLQPSSPITSVKTTTVRLFTRTTTVKPYSRTTTVKPYSKTTTAEPTTTTTTVKPYTTTVPRTTTLPTRKPPPEPAR